MTTPSTTMLTYQRGDDIDYASLDFNPDMSDHPDDSMEQNRELHEIHNLLRAHVTDFDSRPDIFLDRETNICYDRRNLNVRVSPDVYLAFGVDANAIRPRKLYLPWEAGKPPDWVLEIASESTRRVDLVRKPPIYAQIGVPEFWRFDPTGGRYYRFQLNGLKLVDGEYQPIELSTEPDRILKGYSDALSLSLCWHDGEPLLYDPTSGEYLEDWQDERAARLEAEVRAEAAEAEVRRLREQLRRQ